MIFVDKYDADKYSYTEYVYYTVPSQYGSFYPPLQNQIETGSPVILKINNFKFQKYLKFRLILVVKEHAEYVSVERKS